MDLKILNIQETGPLITTLSERVRGNHLVDVVGEDNVKLIQELDQAKLLFRITTDIELIRMTFIVTELKNRPDDLLR